MPTGAGVHHLGFWSDDVKADADALLAGGSTLEASAPNPDGSHVWAYGNNPAGARIELVSRAIEPLISTLFQPAP